MGTEQIYNRLSVRITDIDSVGSQNDGSGFLYVTQEDAFVFTAAHVIQNQKHTYEIECFCRRDEVEAAQRAQYRYLVAGSAFLTHPDYQILDDEKLFNPNDVAGIRLEKRQWMQQLPTVSLTVPVREQQVWISGYPAKKWDESIEFAEKTCCTKTKSVSLSEKRLQFDYPDNADWSSMGTVLEGFSGCGVYADADNEPLLVGILTSGQGKNLPHGAINAVSSMAIKELCDAEGWPSPPEVSEMELCSQLSEGIRQKTDEMQDLIRQAQMHLAQAAGNSPEQDLLLLKKASALFAQYLDHCGEEQAKAFYREMGGAFLDCAMLLKQYGLIVQHIDGIIGQTADPDTAQRMYFMKAFVQVELELPVFDTLRHLELPDQNAMYLHMDFKTAMDQYTQTLEDASVCSVDARAGIQSAKAQMEQYQTNLEEMRQSIQTIVDKMEAPLSNRNGALSQAAHCLYCDRINGLLACKNAEGYKEAIEQYRTLFPALSNEHEINHILLSEVCGEPEKTEVHLLKYVLRNYNPQRIQCLMNFYFRNLDYDGLLEFYEGRVESRDGTGQFARSNLIWAYLDYLTKPGCMTWKALTQFLKYKDEIVNANLRDILEMRMNHRCFQYSKYDKWMKTADFWVNETHHEEEYRDAILMSVHNLQRETAEYYYNDFVRHCLSSMNPDEQKKQCPNWMWPYFALTAPGEGTGNPRVILNETLDHHLGTVRNRNPEEFEGWKRLQSMEEKTVIIDGPTLYYLSKHGLLQKVFRSTDQVLITYSTIGWYLEHERYAHDPVIENIFRWIQEEGRATLSEASLESQCAFRDKFGNDGWYLKGCHCLAKEKNITIVGAYHNHEGMLEEMKPYIIWAGDFIGSIDRF